MLFSRVFLNLAKLFFHEILNTFGIAAFSGHLNKHDRVSDTMQSTSYPVCLSVCQPLKIGFKDMWLLKLEASSYFRGSVAQQLLCLTRLRPLSPNKGGSSSPVARASAW